MTIIAGKANPKKAICQDNSGVIKGAKKEANNAKIAMVLNINTMR